MIVAHIMLNHKEKWIEVKYFLLLYYSVGVEKVDINVILVGDLTSFNSLFQASTMELFSICS